MSSHWRNRPRPTETSVEQVSRITGDPGKSAEDETAAARRGERRSHCGERQPSRFTRSQVNANRQRYAARYRVRWGRIPRARPLARRHEVATWTEAQP